MPRLLIVLLTALALALAACAQDAAAPDTTDGDGAANGGTAQDCEAAFAQIDPDDAMEAIEQGGDALDDTIAACESVDEWIEQAADVLGIDESASLLFVEGRCRSNPELVHVGPCTGFSSPEPTSS